MPFEHSTVLPMQERGRVPISHLHLQVSLTSLHMYTSVELALPCSTAAAQDDLAQLLNGNLACSGQQT